MIYTIIFSIIGLYLGGLGGAFGGFLIGSLFDSIRNGRRARKAQEAFTESRQQYYNDPQQFEDQMLTLIAYVAKADNNRLLQSEFDFCKQYFQKTFPHSDISELMLKFRDILNASDTASACQEACSKISQYATIHEKMAILQCLFGFATADGNAHQQELEAIHRIANWCGVNDLTYEALKMMYTSSYSNYGGGYSGSYGGGYSGGYGGYYDQSGGSSYTPRSGPSLDDCYKILEVSPNATDEEVKKAYRVAAMKHHPDKVSHLGEDVRKQAEEKFAKVNEAYDKIKAARGMK
ncbi:MAG: DnaJ domain-containing protein [Bacteroidales bacterium]|nr:DnaJ domain-containing protein [Bacteroidales bacterium]